MEQYLELISVPAIAAIVYGALGILKSAIKNETFNKLIPIIAAALGAVCGVIAFFAIPAIIPAENVWLAIVIGAASGLTATGTNQIFKQLSKDKDETDNSDKKE